MRGFAAGFTVTAMLLALGIVACKDTPRCPPLVERAVGVPAPMPSGACGSWDNGVAMCVFGGTVYTCVDEDRSASCSLVHCAPVAVPQPGCPVPAEAPR